MAAYMIVIAKISDREKFLSGYGPAAAALVDKFGGKYVLRAPGAELLEGSLEDGSSMVISEWPDKGAIRKFWDSDEYQEVKLLREGIADCQVLMIDSDKING